MNWQKTQPPKDRLILIKDKHGMNTVGHFCASSGEFIISVLCADLYNGEGDFYFENEYLTEKDISCWTDI